MNFLLETRHPATPRSPPEASATKNSCLRRQYSIMAGTRGLVLLGAGLKPLLYHSPFISSCSVQSHIAQGYFLAS